MVRLISTDVQKFHDESLVFLAYTVTPLRLARTHADLSHMARWLDGPKIDLPKLKQGGVDAIFLSVGSESVIIDHGYYWAPDPPQKFWIKPVFTGPAEIKRILWSIDALHEMMAQNSDIIEPALSAADVERIVAKGKIAGIIHITRGLIDDDLVALRTYHRLGVRGMQIAYDDGHPPWIDAATHPPQANGLSDFGREVILEMNRLGMVIDLAHASDKAQADVLAVSQKPVLNSHSGARALCGAWRNLSDETLQAFAAHGSMVGAFFGSGYLEERFGKNPGSAAANERLIQRQRALAEQYAGDPLTLALAVRNPPAEEETAAAAPTVQKPKRAPLSTLLRHMDYCMAILGEDNYCLGSDFGGIDDDGAVGLDEPSKMANLTAAMLEHGYSQEKTRKILGTNLLEFFREVVGS